ncbi:MAG: Fe-S cluster assembly protein SufD [Gammaproteobacteria bacterium]|nr:Fe-S cluster assembly protein SufD [Gammaproteobacteria bacterium]
MTDLLTPQLNSRPSVPEWLQARRLAGRAAWYNSRLPTRKYEDWKYTSLHPLQQEFTPAPASEASATELALDLPKLTGNLLVFVNGHWREDLSSLTAEDSGLELVRFSNASQEQSDLITEHLGTALVDSKPLFAMLNDAALSEGVLLRVRANCRSQHPVQIVWHTSNASSCYITNHRLLVLAEAQSEATLIEHFSGSASAFTNSISELNLAPDAKLNHSRLHLESGEAMHIGGVHARLERNSTLESFHLAVGGKLKRIDIAINHQGSGAHCQLDGVYLLREQEHVDYHTCIEHAVPECTTDENFRGIVGDRARAVFNGRIHIHPNAQNTRAELSNKNLLTSANAEVNTKPELEIYADDVQCAHGATVAQLSDAMLHYMETRGIPADEAKVLLSYGFINSLLESHAIESLHHYLKPLLKHYFGSVGEAQAGSAKAAVLTRHIGGEL